MTILVREGQTNFDDEKNPGENAQSTPDELTRLYWHLQSDLALTNDPELKRIYENNLNWVIQQLKINDPDKLKSLGVDNKTND